jgi:hypothetical protein
LLALWAGVFAELRVEAQSVFLEKAVNREGWEQGSELAVKGRASAEVEQVEQASALEPLRVEPVSGLEIPLSLEVEMEQE